MEFKIFVAYTTVCPWVTASWFDYNGYNNYNNCFIRQGVVLEAFLPEFEAIVTFTGLETI